MSNKNIPIKTSFSGLDYKEWKLHSVTFRPFENCSLNDIYDFARDINKIYNFISDSKIENKEEMIERLQEAKNFANSTFIFDNRGNLVRVFFNTPEDLENFIKNYKEGE